MSPLVSQQSSAPFTVLAGQHVFVSALVPVCGAQNNLVMTSPAVYSPSGANAHIGNSRLTNIMSNIEQYCLNPHNIKVNTIRYTYAKLKYNDVK